MGMKVSVLFIVLSFFALSFLFLDVDLRYPSYFPAPAYDFKKHSLNPEIVQAGRFLFYDPTGG